MAKFLRSFFSALKSTAAERRDRGARLYRWEALGFFDRGFNAGLTVHRSPDHMNVEAARTAALIWAGKVAEGTAPAGKRSGVKFEDAFADYLDYLERKAVSKGKAARTYKTVATTRCKVPDDVSAFLLGHVRKACRKSTCCVGRNRALRPSAKRSTKSPARLSPC
jgi:hypothetical protein